MSEQTRAGAIVALLIAIGVLFLSRFRPAFSLLFTTGRAALVAFLVVLAATGAGLIAIRLTRRVFRQSDDAPIAAADALLIGFAALGTLLGIVAWIGIALDVVVAIVTIVLATLCLVQCSRIAFERPPMLVVPLLFAIVEAITPVNSPDELVYKLATAHTWQLYGRMLELPLASHSYLAMAIQLGDLSALVLGGGIAAKLVHLALYFATLIVIRRLTDDFGVAVIAWAPALMIIAGFAWTEWPLIGLLLLSFEKRSDYATSFAALGSAVACKYTALPWLLAYAIVFAWRDRKLLPRAALVVIAFGALFYVRNAIWTGSPVAPLLLPDAPALAHYRGEGAWSDLLHGVAIFDPAIADESLGIVLPAFALIGIFARSELAWIGLIQLPILFALAPVPRNLAGGLVPLAIAGATLVPRNRLIAIVTSIAFAAQAVLVVFVLNSFDLGSYLSGTETQAQYVARVRGFARPYAFIDANTPPDARVLLLGENRSYDLDRQSIAGSNLDGPRIAAWLARFPTPDALVAEWRRLGVTHVVLHKQWYRAGAAPLQPIEREYVLQVSPDTDRVLTAALKTRAVLRYRDDSYLVFELR